MTTAATTIAFTTHLGSSSSSKPFETQIFKNIKEKGFWNLEELLFPTLPWSIWVGFGEIERPFVLKKCPSLNNTNYIVRIWTKLHFVSCLLLWRLGFTLKEFLTQAFTIWPFDWVKVLSKTWHLISKGLLPS